MGIKFYRARNLISSNFSIRKTNQILIILCLLISSRFSSYSQTSAFSFTQIPLSNTDLITPGRGVENWNGVSWNNQSGGGVMVPSGNTKGLNAYYRFDWGVELETSQGVYSWTKFDQQINAAIDAGQMFSFGLMPMCSACNTLGGISGLTYPPYLHNLMQAEASNSRDWYYSAGGLWVPNWNSPNYLARYQALLNAVAAHIASGSHNGKNYRDVIYYIDIRGYGDFGEWHTWPWYGTEPTGRKATSATLKALIDMNLAAFPNYPNVIMAGAYDPGGASLMPADVSYYALTRTNAWGQIGWRRDNWGDPGESNILDKNPGSYNPGSGSVSFAPIIMNKYKYAPVVGEPDNSMTNISSCGSQQCDLPNEIKLYHATSFGNGNYPNTSDPALQANVMAASKLSGFRLILTGGNMTTTLTSGSVFNLTLNWQNIGVAPVYENWNVVYELRKSDGTVVWTGNSAFKPKFFLPQASPTAASDNFTLSSIPAGTYSMYLIVRDPVNYKAPLIININGRNADGSYLLRSNIVVGTGGPVNQPPKANAGVDQIIQLPTSTVSLAGSGTDADGTIASYAWSKLSGPAGDVITSPATANTNITGLVQGVYLYILAVTDNLGAIGTDTMMVTVNPPVANQPPIANAGPDQNITLPTNSVTINGSASSDPDGSIASYLWTKISGPTQFTIGNTIQASTVVNNLTAGLYSFQLKVTDNLGAIALDTIKVIVNAAPANLPPIANAGANISVTLPTNVANLNGTASKDPDGTISSYLWSQVSGPSTAAITTPANVTTGISALQQGVYVFSLKVTDNSGASNLDSIAVTVNPASNIPPVANAGTSKSVILPVNSTSLDGSLSSDPDGSIVSYSWAQLSGPSTATVTGGTQVVATAANLVAGLYTFELTVTDNQGATAKASVKISVVSSGIQPPVANAGADQTITLPTNSVTIDGSGSSASSGTIISYTWTEKSGPSIVSLANTSTNTLNNLQAGVYIFILKVTDNNAATGSDSVKITVNPAVNQAPVADAGAGISLTLPANSTTLDGTKSFDPDGTISTYTWIRISGPNNPATSGANTATLNVSGLVAGQYIYQLTVTDNSGASSSARVKIIVMGAANIPPLANAGPNQSITAPANSVNLDGSASTDPDGTITAYSWVTVSGPGSVTINNSNTATPSVTGLQIGVYIFELTVTDNGGATAANQVTVIVNPKTIVPNQSPVANAGSNQTIVLPQNSLSLNGTSSFDPDGTIAGYNWTQLSGPSTAVIAGGNTSTPAVSKLVVGQYVFQLVVTDNNGATNNDQVAITVNPAVAKVNQPPVANAGINDTITLPQNNYTLNASQSTDPGGTIQSYQWQEIGGPNTVNSSSMNSPQVTISGLLAGDYEFQVTVTDNAGATSTATMKLTVEAGLAADQLLVYPNPAHDMTNVKITSTITGTVKINVYDMNGRLVMITEAEKSGDLIINSLNISTLASGLYTIQITIANRKTLVTKFIKN